MSSHSVSLTALLDHHFFCATGSATGSGRVGGVVKSKRALIDGTGANVHFRVALAAKDLRLVTQAAERAGVRLESAEANRRIYEEATRSGLADEDYGSVIPFLRDRAS